MYVGRLAGMIMLGLGGSSFTKDFAVRYLVYAFSQWPAHRAYLTGYHHHDGQVDRISVGRAGAVRQPQAYLTASSLDEAVWS